MFSDKRKLFTKKAIKRWSTRQYGNIAQNILPKKDNFHNISSTAGNVLKQQTTPVPRATTATATRQHVDGSLLLIGDNDEDMLLWQLAAVDEILSKMIVSGQIFCAIFLLCRPYLRKLYTNNNAY